MKFVFQTRKSEQNQQEDMLTDCISKRLQLVGLCLQLAALNINNQVFYVKVRKYVTQYKTLIILLTSINSFVCTK